MPTGDTLVLPRRQREGSITDEQLEAVHQAINNLTNKRGAVVVCEGMESENSARNKARSMALLHEEAYLTIPDPAWKADPEAKDEEGKPIPVEAQEAPQVVNPRRYLTAHAVQSDDGKYIGAVSIRNPQESKAETPGTTPAPAAAKAPEASPPAAKSKDTTAPPAAKAKK